MDGELAAADAGVDPQIAGVLPSAVDRLRARLVRQTLFDAFDANADGTVDSRELAVGLAALHALAATESADDNAPATTSALVEALAALSNVDADSPTAAAQLHFSDAAAFLRAEELVRQHLTGASWPPGAAAAGSNRTALAAALAPNRAVAARRADALVSRLRAAVGGAAAVPLGAFIRWHASVASESGSRDAEDGKNDSGEEEEEPAAPAAADPSPPPTVASVREALCLAAFTVDDVAALFQEQCDAAARVGAGLDRDALQDAGAVDPTDALVVPALSRPAFEHACGLLAQLGGGGGGGDARAIAARLFRVLDFDGDGKVSLGEVVAGARGARLRSLPLRCRISSALPTPFSLPPQPSPCSCPAATATRRPRSSLRRLTATVSLRRGRGRAGGRMHCVTRSSPSSPGDCVLSPAELVTYLLVVYRIAECVRAPLPPVLAHQCTPVALPPVQLALRSDGPWRRPSRGPRAELAARPRDGAQRARGLRHGRRAVPLAVQVVVLVGPRQGGPTASVQ